MADVSKIKLTDNTEYDIKDAIARQSIATTDEKTDEIIEQLNNPTYTTTEGTDLSIDNTRVGKMKLEYYGDTEQETTTGKNLFNPSNVYLGKAWNNADNTARAIAYVPLTIGNTYTISMQKVSAVDMVLYNETDTSTLPYSIAPNRITTTTTITATKNYLYFQFNKTSVTINDILAIGIQVETGSTASAYEPYTGGIASPNPDYPQEVKTFTGENTITIENEDGTQSQSYELNLASRNLINPNFPFLGTSNGITSTYNSANQSISFSGTTSGTFAFLTNKISVNIPKGEYTFSIDKTVSSHTIIFRMYYNASQYQDVTILVNTTSRTMSITNDTIAYQIYMGGLTSGATLNNTLNFQIEKGSQATSFVKYFTPIELCDQDYIHDNGGKWFKHKEIDKISFDGSETWTQGNPNYRYYTDKTGQANTSVIPKSNYFTGGVYAYGVIVQNFSATVVRFNFYYDSMAGDVNAFKTWLSTKKPNVYYALATPIEEEITEPTLINQLNAIKYGAESYYGQTNIIITSEELQPILKVQTMDKIV